MTKFFAVTILLASLSQGLWAFTVTGTLSYEKRVYTANNGVGTVVATPLSNAKILASDNSSTTNDATGSFSLNLASGSTYSVSVRSENSRFSVGTSSTSSPYSVFIGSGITGDNVITRTIKESEKSGAFNILVQLQTGVDWFAARGKNFSIKSIKP